MIDEAEATLTAHDRAPASSSAPPLLLPGAMVDHFRVMRPLGHGGMGEVYLARDTKLGRRVALKIIQRSLLGSQEAVERFHVEARATARLNHPNIVTIHAVGEHGTFPYVALEYVEGESLSARLRGRDNVGIAEALRIGLAVAEGIAEAHRYGVVHRDLKPGNVLVGTDGRIRLLDFGLATMDPEPGLTALHEGEELGSGSPSGFEDGFLGTPAFMAPERWSGALGGQPTDIWSFGVLMFRLVTGRMPFPQRDRSELAAAVMLGEPPALDGEDVPAPLRALVRRCLAGAPEGRPPASEVVAVLRDMLLEGQRTRAVEESPFRGLLAFRERHADLFFGRDAEVAALVERLRTEPVVAVVGPSGAGKSSLVDAGVVPRLREQERWTVVRIRPGGAPMKALAASLTRAATTEATKLEDAPTRSTDERAIAGADRAPGVHARALAEQTRSRVMLFVDQLEELFTLCDDPDEIARFLRSLHAAADDPQEPIRVIYTVRDDFLGRVAASVPGSTFAAVHPVRSPEPTALREILTGPLSLVNYRYEDDALPTEMVEAVRDEPACLPLLEFTAQALWERRDRGRRLLLRAEYAKLGGVEGALARHADGVLAELSHAELPVAREILLRLVTPDRTRRLVLRAVALEGLGERAERVLSRLTAARLVQTSRRRGSSGDADEATLELAHESLIYTWSTLSSWIDASGEELAFLSEVTQAADLWDRRGRRDEELWEGDALADALRTRARCGTAVPELVDRFLSAGRDKAQRRSRRRRIAITSGMAMLAAIAVVLAFQKHQADVLRDRAEEQRAEAEVQRAEALREGARSALARGSVLEARAKLRTALEAADSVDARALWWVLQNEPLVWQSDPGLSAYRVAFAPDGRTIAASRMSGAVYLIDVETGAGRALRGLGGSPFAIAFSPDGSSVAAGSLSGDARVWDAHTGELVGEPMAHPSVVFDITFHPDGDRIATACADGVVRSWDLREGERVPSALGEPGPAARSVAFDGAGRRLASGDDAGTVRLFDLRDASVAHVLGTEQGPIYAVRFSPDGDGLATAGHDGTVRLWATATGRGSAVLRGHGARVNDLSFTGDGTLLASGSQDGTIRLWDPRTREPLGRRSFGPEGLRGIAFSSSGRRIAISAMGAPVRVLDLGIEPADEPEGHDGPVLAVAIAPSGRLVASGGTDGTVQLLDVTTGDRDIALRGHAPSYVTGLDFSPGGDILATTGRDQMVRLWDMGSGEQLREIALGRVQHYGRSRFTPDGAWLAVPEAGTTVSLWEVATGRRGATFEGRENMATLAFSPDGRTLASTARDGSILVWNVPSRGAARVLPGHDGGSEGIAFTPDGRALFSGGQDGALREWDLSTGEGRLVGRHPAPVYAVDVASAGGWAASASGDGTARLWHLPSDRERELAHPAEVNSVAFGPQGDVLATAADDGTVRLWNVSDGAPLWYGRVLVPSPARALTHRGWLDIQSGEPASMPDAEWVRAAEGAMLASARDSLLCTWGGGEVSAWDLGDGRLVARTDEARVVEILASALGCVIRRADEIVVLDGRRTQRIELDSPALAMGLGDGATLLVATADAIVEVGSDRRPHEIRSVPGGEATAVAGGSDRVAIGYRDGNLELLDRRRGPATVFEQTPPSPVTRVTMGPAGTVLAGFADGSVGMWSASGQRLRHTRLHGPVQHLALYDQRVHAVTALGRHRTLDLGVLYEDRCTLLREVWSRVPVVWEEGRAVVRERPMQHPCAVTSAP